MEKVLIVDDDSLFRKMLKDSLHSQLPSLNILEAKTGQEAMEIIQTSHPDLIFMGIQLPDGNGLEVTHQIKKLYPEVKVIIVTNYDQPEYREAAFRFGGDCYIPKDSLAYVRLEKLVKTLVK